MDRDRLEALLTSVAASSTTVAEAVKDLETLPFADLGFARPDMHRAIRQGFPEVIYCPGKSAEQIVAIAKKLLEAHRLVLATRADSALAAQVEILCEQNRLSAFSYRQSAGTIIFGEMPPLDRASANGTVAVLTAGTVDIAVAEEVALLIEAGGFATRTIYDVGVAGLHRLLDKLPEIRECAVTVVVAGMDGALPSVVAGLVAMPVIAVPTSAGYGTGEKGLAALMCMLNSCAPGLTVVNIDNGFGAAMAALRLLLAIKK